MSVTVPDLSILVIVRDRAPELPGLLANIRGLAGQTVVLDGGSTDGGRELLAATAGVELVEEPWGNNFARARNRALARARGRWVLFLDTDERVGDVLRRRLPRLVRSRWFDYYRLPMYWIVSLDPPRYIDTPEHYPCHRARLFRRIEGLAYDEAQPLHERIPRERRGRRGRRLHRGHLFHLAPLLLDHEGLRRRLGYYDGLAPQSRDLHRRIYEPLLGELPTRPCREGFRA